MAFPEPDPPVPTSGSLPDGVLRDDFDTPTLLPEERGRAAATDGEAMRR
ncbi:hypothetical protein [Streptomyces sp. CB03911]